MFSLFDKLLGGRRGYDDEDEDIEANDMVDEYEDDEEDDSPDYQAGLRSKARPGLGLGSYNRNEPRSRSAAQPDYGKARVVDIHTGNAAQERNAIVLMEPCNKTDAERVCDEVRNGRSVICTLVNIDPSVKQRIIDYLTGATYALKGSLLPVTSDIFAIAPSSTKTVDVTKAASRQQVNHSPEQREQRARQYNRSTQALGKAVGR